MYGAKLSSQQKGPRSARYQEYNSEFPERVVELAKRSTMWQEELVVAYIHGGPHYDDIKVKRRRTATRDEIRAKLRAEGARKKRRKMAKK